MKITPNRSAVGAGIHFTSIIDPKFKRNQISLHAIVPLLEETAAENAIVPLLLRKGCKSYPDFSSLNARLDELYGASLSPNISKFNGYQIISLTITALDNRFALEGEDIIADCTALLSELFFEPVLDEQGLFPKNDVALERQFIIDTIESEINDKRSYAMGQCLRHLAKGEPLSIRTYGEVKTATAITPQSATKAWKRIQDTARIEMFFTGCGNPTNAQATLETIFATKTRNPAPLTILPLGSMIEKISEITEQMEIQQGNLVLGLRVPSLDTPKKKNAARLFSAIYGGTPFSKLFLNVREKLSLCYYCSSSIDVVNHVMLIGSGIEFENKEKAQTEILHQLEQMRQGNFTEEEINESKLLLTGSITRSTDSIHSLESWYFQRALLGEMISPEEEIQNINTITHEDIVTIAKDVILDTVYFLTGKKA